MSIPKRVSVTCPECGGMIETTIFDSLNTDFAPDTAESVISGARFAEACPHCGFTVRMEYDMLYHDMKNRAMIWVLHPGEPDYAERAAEIRAVPAWQPMTRIVPDMNALREKAACLEAGRDDRLMELCKLMLSAQLMQQMPELELENVFYTYQGGTEAVFFYDGGGKEIHCDPGQVYDAMAKIFTAALAETEEEPFPVIDAAWAKGFLKNQLENEETEENEE